MTDTLPRPLLARDGLWRAALWLPAACLLLLPLVAMQFTREVQWSVSDFAVFGAMLLVACIGGEIVLRASRDPVYRLAAAIAVGTGFLLAWAALGVGLIGNGAHPANLIFVGVLLVGGVGAIAARLRPRGVAVALAAAAALQAAGAVAAWIVGDRAAVWPLAAFVLPWSLAAWLFALAARRATAR